MATRTKPDRTRQTAEGHGRQPGELSIGQRNAVDLLILGGTDAEAATAANVTRQTVCDWRNHDAEFQAELNRARAALWTGATDQLRALVPRALSVLAEALAAQPDPKVALDILRLAGIGAGLGTVGIGPQSAAEIDDLVTEVAERRALADLWRSDLAAPRRLG